MVAIPTSTPNATPHDSELSAGRPRRTNAVVNFAVVDANRTSHASIWMSPIPAAPPFTAAMIGFGISRASVMGQRRRLEIGRLRACPLLAALLTRIAR